MTIAFRCENCGKSFEVDGALAGKKCKCKQCGHIFSIPVPRQPSSRPRNLQTFGASEDSRASTASRPASSRPAPSSPPRPQPSPAPAYDPYEDLGPPAIPTVDLENDEEFLPPRPAKPAPERKKRSKRRSSGFSIESIPGWVYLLLGLGFVVAITVACTSRAGLLVVAGGSVLVGMIMMAIGGIGLIVIAFTESVACGLLYLFVPFYCLYYVITRWADTKRFFLLSLGGWLMVIALGIFLPAVQAARNAADQARRRGQPGSPTAEAETIITGLIDANNELGSLLATVNSAPDAERIAPRYNQIRDQIDAFDRRMKELPPLNAFENQRLGFQYNLRLNKSSDLVTGHYNRLRAIPGVLAYLNQSRQEHTAASGANPSSVPFPAPGFTGPGGNGQSDVNLVDDALSELKEFDPPRRKRALGRLAHAPVNASRRVEVAEAITPMLQDPDGWTRGDAAKALAVWGGPESVPALIEAINDSEFAVRWAAIDALKVLKDPQAAGALATKVAENKDRGKAVDALKAIGPPAESAVIPLLGDGDHWVRREACLILKEIGTEASVPGLKTIAMRNAGLDSRAAVEALDALRLRNIDTNPRRPNADGSGTDGSPFKKKSPFLRRRP
jgi:hypothetical protein